MWISIVLFCVQDAIAGNQFYDGVLTISDGDVEAALGEAEHVLEGEARVGGQDHFYLETQACLAVPKGEDGEMEITSSSQGLSFVQRCAAAALGVPWNRIVTKVKRLGKKLSNFNSISLCMYVCMYAWRSTLQSCKVESQKFIL